MKENSILRECKKVLQNRMTNKMKNILMKSVIQGDETKFIRTLNNFSLVLDQSYFDYELLKIALANKLGNIAKILITRGCRVRNPRKTNLEETPLHLAMKLEDLSVISTILNNDASIYDKNLQGDTPLQAAFKESYYNAVSAVLDYITNCNLSFNPDNKDDVVHFHIACIRMHVASVKMYLSLRFDVNSYLSIDDSAKFSGLTPLHYVISQNVYYGTDLFQILLEHSDLTVKNSNGLTPLHSIYYNYDDGYNDEDCYSDSFELYDIMTKVFDCGNDTKFINAVDNSGVSHFHLSCSTNYPEWVQVFIDSGVDVNRSISFNCSRNPGFTALHFAAKHACIEIVELLLKNGADCNRADKNGVTPLHVATQFLDRDDKAFEIIDMLLDYSACPIAVDRLGSTPIHLIFHKIMGNNMQYKNIMDKLISKIPLKVNLTDKTDLSFFHIVCTRNYPDRVNDYLNSGVAINSVTNSSIFHGYTGLHFAVTFNQRNVVEVLLKKNAQVTFSSLPNFTSPLHLACEFTLPKYYEVCYEYIKKCQTNDKPEENLDWIPNRTKQLDIIKLLLLYGADIEAEDYWKCTPLFSAFRFDRDLIDYCSNFVQNSVINEINARLIEITKIFCSNKANISGSKHYQGGSIFHMISKSGLPKISDQLMECLLTAGAAINAVDKNGLTPLHLAARYSKDELVQSFLKYKANANVKCKKFETPLKLAINVYEENKQFSRDNLYKSDQSCIRILLEYGSDVNAKTPDGRSLLHDAVSCSSEFLIENLLKHGADINVEDSSGNSPVCSLLTNGEINDLDIWCIIFIHVQMLLALGLYVSDKVQKLYYFFLQYSKTSIRDSLNKMVVNELNRMKIKNIDNYTSLYTLLKDSHKLSKYVRNKKLIDILEVQDINKTFPFYSYLLKLQYKRGLLRRDVLKEATSSLIYITSSNLPEECYDSILSYLTNEEVVNLNAAAAGKTKRKLSDNYSNETEPSIKSQKQEKNLSEL